MLNTIESVRIDKWVWAVRICKTRQIASDLCKRQKILVDGQRVKASRGIRPGQMVSIKKEGIEWVYKVVLCIDKRVSAPLAAQCREDLTPRESLERLKMMNDPRGVRRLKGMGRPTKKERRNMEKALSSFDNEV